MSKHRLKGREIMLFMGASHATTQAIGGSVSAEIEISASLIEVSDPNSSQWLDFIVGRKSWKMTLGKLLILPDFYDGEKVGQKVTVKITAIDFEKKRISLSMKALLNDSAEEAPAETEAEAAEEAAVEE